MEKLQILSLLLYGITDRPKVVKILKDKGIYEDTEKPAWICDYPPNIFWGEEKKVF